MPSQRNHQLQRAARRASEAASSPDLEVSSRRGMDWARWIELGSVVLASLVAVAGLWYSNIQVQGEVRATREGQITDRYNAAVTNLGDDALDVRLGGIYALQRIMTDSPRDHPTIANILATYIRTHSRPSAADEDHTAEQPDVYAAANILVTRNPDHDNGFIPNLSAAELRGADLSDAFLEGADLRGADLSGVFMTDADLSSALLMDADLNRAFLSDTDLSLAFLDGADLRGGASMFFVKGGVGFWVRRRCRRGAWRRGR
ncbi:pentapeptide repeat-containing protein [Streptomyces sp. NBC_01803]|nr:pentapeptide repeat-containing protein [Streptomyces sp. NBC_01803]WSA42738.1 pentapeptide repeat-containing protein [Streptomyces sp. NBC_01803]